VIAVDTSALMAIVVGEPEAEACKAALDGADAVVISAGTVAEALIVASRRNVLDVMAKLIAEFGFEIVPVTEASARRIGGAYQRWGKGMSPAKLNFGDCFAYDVAKEHGCRLLYVGGDFARTDIEGAL